MGLLEVKNLTKSFGGLRALNNVNMEVDKGEILGIIGPNGAGKTTLFNSITGFYRPDGGQVLFKGENITGLEPHEVCQRGICRTFQLVKPFAELTVLDNVMIGSFSRTSNRAEARKQARGILDFTRLRGREEQLAKELTTPDRKRLELARTLATEPELLLLDEVMTGLTPTESAVAQELVRKVRDGGVTILVVEHVMRAVMSISDRIVVLHYGEVIAQGTPKEISQNERVIESYLGRASFA
ncbi:Lipopolysaccharide export system ATP-binding protein LptB [subsurface metagenome]